MLLFARLLKVILLLLGRLLKIVLLLGYKCNGCLRVVLLLSSSQCSLLGYRYNRWLRCHRVGVCVPGSVVTVTVG
jgi:hypothetical protein